MDYLRIINNKKHINIRLKESRKHNSNEVILKTNINYGFVIRSNESFKILRET